MPSVGLRGTRNGQYFANYLKDMRVIGMGEIEKPVKTIICWTDLRLREFL